MKKTDVALFIIQIKSGAHEALYMKVYKDGTLIRSGCGGLPPIPVSGMTAEGDKRYWDTLLALIPDQMVENPVNYVEPDIQHPLEYALAFFGASSNGETGEQAQWTQTSGVRFLLDSSTSFNHPLLGFLDSFAVKAAELTNTWYFDIMVSAIFHLRPVNLENTFVSIPPTEQERQRALSNYIQQMAANPRWDIVGTGHGRSYTTSDGKKLRSCLEKDHNGAVSIRFEETVDNPNPDEV